MDEQIIKKEDKRYKELYPVSWKKFALEAINDYLDQRKDSLDDFKHILKPNELKAEIRKIIQFEIQNIKSSIKVDMHRVAKEEIEKELYNIKYELFEIVKEELPKEEMIKIVKERLDSHLTENFEPIILRSLKVVNKEVTDKIGKKLKGIMDLKTSTISEISGEIRKLGSKKEEDYLIELKEVKLIEDKDFIGDSRYLQWFKDGDKES